MRNKVLATLSAIAIAAVTVQAASAGERQKTRKPAQPSAGAAQRHCDRAIPQFQCCVDRAAGSGRISLFRRLVGPGRALTDWRGSPAVTFIR